MTTQTERKKKKTNRYPFWCVRFWHGMRVGDWAKLLAENRFRIHPSGIGLTMTVSIAAPFNSVLGGIQQLRYGRPIRATEIRKPPVFIVGHWRSGTTFLHELMVRDDRFASPNTYECFAPHHFLVSAWFFTRYFGFMLPKQRPMDNMAAGFLRPQEDEFALMNLGLPSTYRRMAFPNNPVRDINYLNMEGLSDEELAAWQDGLTYFLCALTLRYGKQVILKSPPHTGRIGVLAKMFPGARFVHIARDPYDIFASTRHLWPSLEGVQCFQSPRYEHLDEYIFECYDRMYRGFFGQCDSIPDGHLHCVRYEDVVRDPVGQVREIYEKLDLGDFAPVQPKLEAFVATQKDYQTNRHEMEPEIKAEIRRRWSEYFERFGYAEESASK